MPTAVNEAQGTGGPDCNVNVTIPSSPDRMFVCRYEAHSTVSGANARASSIAIDPGGLALGLSFWGRSETGFGADHRTVEIWYLVDPPVGTYVCASIAMGANVSSAQHDCTIVEVDTANPFRSAIATANGNSSTPSVAVPSMPGDLAIDVVMQNGFGTLTAGAGQTAEGTSNVLGATTARASYETGASPAVTMSWSSTIGDYWVIGSVSVMPKLEERGRIIAYQTDIADPERRILNYMGKVLAAWDIEPDQYCFYLSRQLPTVKAYANLNDNPAVEYIEEVSWNIRSPRPTMRGNRNQLPDVFMARATGGSTV